MKEQIIYIGYKEVRLNNKIVVTIAVSPDSEDFTDTYYQITAESGKGSFADLLFMLKRGLEKSERRLKANEKI